MNKNRRGIYQLLLFLFLSSASSLRAIEPPSGNDVDQALWWLYHLQYTKARESIDAHVAAQPEDPTGYFYRTAFDWWELAQDLENTDGDLKKKFENDFNDTIQVAQKYLLNQQDSKKKAVALLCQGGALGLRGRWYVTQNEW